MLSQRNINAVNDFDTFETTEDRLTFLIHIPIHAGCGNKPATEKTTVITTKKTTEKIVRLMKANPYITNKELAEVCGITEDGIFCAYPTGVALGRELPDGNSEMKTFVTYDMLRGEQIEKGENQSRAAKMQEEEGFRNCKELVDKLVKYGIHL